MQIEAPPPKKDWSLFWLIVAIVAIVAYVWVPVLARIPIPCSDC